MRDAKLVKVMKVSQTKDERRHENGASETSSRTQKQGNTSGTEKTFLGDGSRYHVSPGGPVSPEISQRLEAKPLMSSPVNDERLIQGACEQQDREPQSTSSIDEPRRPVAHKMQWLANCHSAMR